ncbi:MAG: N-acetylmuramoyl-L-alanine amidase [Pseudomonadota bacterium]|nr:N-acetylmuramoyl-L-alanine amidase [Pseudomonadota bacterium]QKK04338.1 MAG: N-acetylmuramoyl-L-alanine amidase [Pseudomonadota bacterium]
MDIIDSPSPNANSRNLPDGQNAPDMLILHYTDTKSAFEALSILQNPETEVSAHYLVDEDGTIYQLVEEEKRAWHAGKSYWDGKTDINSHSIGIEIQNPGHSNGYREFPAEQMEAVTALCQEIMVRHDIPAANVLAHSDIAPGRKRDPGELFDWEFLAKRNIGIWPDVTEEDKTRAAAALKEEGGLTKLFAKFGYNPDLPLETLQDAFAQHFTRDSTKTDSPAELLTSLIRKKRETRKTF